MRKIVELLEKNLNGKLSTGDMVEAEKQLEHWKRELDSMIEIQGQSEYGRGSMEYQHLWKIHW